MGWQYLKGPIANVSYMGWQYLKGPIAKVVDKGWLLWLTSSGLISSVRLGLRRIRLAAVWQGSISLFVRNSNGSSSSQQQAYLRNRRSYTNKLGRPRTYSTSRRQNLSQHLAISGSRAQNKTYAYFKIELLDQPRHQKQTLNCSKATITLFTKLHIVI